MAKPMEKLARLFGRGNGGDLVGQLHARAINRPLLVEPYIGQSLINAYLRAGNDALQPAEAAPPGQQQAPEDSDSQVAVIEISGPMVARQAPGLCGPGPTSYEEIRDRFDRAMGDPNVSSVVLRLDSPGGEAAQVFDLADHIRASRGTKPIFAIADDMAFSAAYAIASAADEIWLSRTAGVGSVGVVAYHVDASEMFESAGVRVEYLYAGERKVDGNPHNPLSDEARERFMAEINRLYEIFVATVAEGRGLNPEAVRATEATTYHGENAVAAGFADRVGSWPELVDYLTNPEAEPPAAQATSAAPVGAPAASAEGEAEGEGKEAPAETAEEQAEGEAGDGAEEGADPSESNEAATFAARLVSALGVEGEQAESFAAQLKSLMGASDAVSGYPSAAAEIRAVCAAAGVPEAADDYIQAGTDITAVRNDLMEMLAAGEQEIRGTRAADPAPQSPGARAPDPDAVHAQLNNPKKE